MQGPGSRYHSLHRHSLWRLPREPTLPLQSYTTLTVREVLVPWSVQQFLPPCNRS